MFEDDFQEAFKITDKKLKDYQIYDKKYIVFEKGKHIYLGKLKNIEPNFYFADIEIYDWDDLENGYNVFQQHLHILEFNVLESFDDFKDAKNFYKIAINSNKFNL